jgi:hypothetical protein
MYKLFSLISILLFVSAANAQSGGTFNVRQSVVASGGGTSGDATNNVFKIEGTSGQVAAGTQISGGNFDIRGGFWTPAPLAPTAANVTIGGRVLTAGGFGIRNARVTLTEADGTTRAALTGAFGYYRFEEIEVGQTVVISITSKRFVFSQPTQILNVTEEANEVNFVSDK